MTQKKFKSLTDGEETLESFITSSGGSGDSGKGIGANSSGKLDSTFLPSGVGRQAHMFEASEALTQGDFVNVFLDSGTMKVRKADNSNDRECFGWVEENVASGSNASVFSTGANPHAPSGTLGAIAYLGTAGGVIETPLDEDTTTGKTHQALGYYGTTTEIITFDFVGNFTRL